MVELNDKKNVKEQIARTKMDLIYHKKKMEYFEEELKILEEFI